MKNLLLVLLVTSLLTACAVNRIFPHQLAQLSVDMPISLVHSQLQQPPAAKGTIQVGHQHFLIERYILASGDYWSDYLLAFHEDGRLLYWGYPHEFKRHQNPLYNQIGDAADTIRAKR